MYLNMIKKPVVLDLFCGAGGAAQGLYLAGFEVVGLDIKPQPRYPFKFHQGDALTFPLEGYDAYWASPPCQRWSITRNMHGNRYFYPDLLTPIRERLVSTGLPYIIENTPGAPLRDFVILCGRMFGLKLIRHRLFESNVLLLVPPHYGCRKGEFVTVAGEGSRCRGYEDYSKWSEAMGIDWMLRKELTQAIPPAYSEFLGKQLIQYIDRR